MNLLFDNNLSPKLADLVSDDFPGSCHLLTLGLMNADDHSIWMRAKHAQFTIVTQDSDFNNICQLRGFPPKIIWLRTGNSKTSGLKKLILKNKRSIREFINQTEEGVLILY